MTNEPKSKSRLLEAVHETARDLHRLGFIDAKNDLLFSSRKVEQSKVNAAHQMILVVLCYVLDAQFFGQCDEQGISV